MFESTISGSRKSDDESWRRRRRMTRIDAAATYWITFYGFLILSTNTVLASWGQSDFHIRLEAKKYVEKGSTLYLRCENNVQPDILSKVTWMKNNNKIFEYINGRNPPFRNFTIPGAVIDWKHSNQQQVTLRNVDYDAAGFYLCEVSTDTPIFTKESNEEEVHVISPQTGPPKIQFSKRQFYIGENLVANCTTSKARPPPHITWLINGKKVDDKHIRMLHPYAAGGKSKHRSKTQSSHSDNNNTPGVDKADMALPEVDIVDAHFPRPHSIDSKGGDNDLQQMNNKMEQIENYPHYRFMAFVDEDGHGSEEVGPALDQHSELDGDYQRVVLDEDGLLHSKHLKHKKNRASSKYRRHVSEGNRNVHKPIVASSQLIVEVSELHADANGRLEITCLATIPAHVGQGEQFADYKTYSVKIDVEQNEATTAVPQPAKLGNMSSSGGALALLAHSRNLWHYHWASAAFTLILILVNLP